MELNGNFNPGLDGQQQLGIESKRWAAIHCLALYVAGAQVAGLNSPVFTGEPKAPTPSGADNSTKLATTAFVQALFAAAKQRSNHSGTQAAATISDFAAAVAATAVGLAAHTSGADLGLDAGGDNPITAAAIVAHIADATKHRSINDSGSASTDLWSAEKIATEISDAITAALDGIGIPTGALADLDSVSTAEIDDEAVTLDKVEGGPSAGPSLYFGTDDGGASGLHDLTANLRLVGSPGTGYAKIELDGSNALQVPLGTDGDLAAAGNDDRFPLAGEKSALAGNSGTPGESNKYLTEAWLADATIDDGDMVAGISTEKGISSPAAIAALVAAIIADSVPSRTGVYRSIWLPGGSAVPNTTLGAAIAADETASPANMWEGPVFTNASTLAAKWAVALPQEADFTTLRFRIHFRAAAGTGDVYWRLNGKRFANGDAENAALGTFTTLIHSVGAAGAIYTTASAAVTLAGTTGNLCLINLQRLATDVLDTHSDDITVVGLEIQYRESETEPTVWA